MTWRQLLLFFLAFAIDVRVKADEQSNLDDFVTFPSHCYNQSYPCAVKSLRKVNQLFHFEDTQFSVSSQSVVQLYPDKLTFVEGNFLIENPSSLKIETLHSNITLKSAMVLVITSKQSTKIVNLGGEILVEGRSQKNSLNLLPGSQIDFGKVTTDGVASSDFPHTVNFESIIRKWGNLTNKDFDGFKLRALAFKREVKVSAEYFSEQFKAIAKRRIASHKAAIKRGRQRRAAIEAENLELRTLFRKKNHFE